VVLWLAIAGDRLQVRPHLVNLLFAMTGYAALMVRRPRLGAPQLAAAFAFMVVWANLHSGALLGAALAGLYALAATVGQRFLGQTPRADELGADRLSRLSWLAGLSLLALACTPHHARLLPYVVESARINAALSLEWKSIVSASGVATRSALALACYAALGAATIVMAWQRRSELPLGRLAVPLFLVALPLSSMRFTWTVFAAIVFVAGEASRSLPIRSERRVAAAATALALALAASELPWRGLLRGVSLQNHFRSATFPIGAMNLLEQLELRGNLFAPNQWGGFILYRTHDRYPIFVDGRWITIGENVIRDAITIAHRRVGTRALLDAYRIEILLVHRGWMTDEVRAAGEWIPAFENYNSGIYLRPGPSREENLRQLSDYFASRGVPFDPVEGFDERAVVEANRAWARRFGVQRMHLDQFSEQGKWPRRAPRRVAGW
jgi:hypothetical protein